MTQAAISALIATNDSISMPPYPIIRTWLSLAHHLRGGARGDQRVEAGQRAAGDRDEHEREQLAGEDRPGALAARSR